MTDVEYILEANHRRARERELGERWDKIFYREIVFSSIFTRLWR